MRNKWTGCATTATSEWLRCIRVKHLLRTQCMSPLQRPSSRMVSEIDDDDGSMKGFAGRSCAALPDHAWHQPTQ